MIKSKNISLIKSTLLNIFVICYILALSLSICSCESEQEKKARIQRQEQERVALIKKQEEDSVRRAEIEEQKQKERIIFDKYLNNSLPNGSTPYDYCFGDNKKCSNYGCSRITVKTPHNSDVLVTIKKSGVVIRHAYIRAGSLYNFEIPNGTYQPFFYYGKGWYPNKFIKNTSCGELKGGFLANEYFGKDEPQYLNNNILSYELILQQNGNFSTKPSNQNEAF